MSGEQSDAPAPKRWRSRQFPDGCIACGTTERKHNAHGLCVNCYKDPALVEAATRGDLPARDDDTRTPFAAGDDSPTDPSGEQRPGTFASPPGDSDAAAAGPTDRPSVLGRIFGTHKRDMPRVDPPTRERRPGRAPKRTDAADTLAAGWSGLAWLVGQMPQHQPLARCMNWQAGATGELLDQVISGTPVDAKLVQPIVRARGKVGLVGAIMGPPAVVYAIERNPNALPVLMPMLRASIEEALPVMVPAMQRAKRKAEAKIKAARELFPDMDVPDGVDPVDIIIAEMFAGYVFTHDMPGDTETPTESAEPQEVS